MEAAGFKNKPSQQPAQSSSKSKVKQPKSSSAKTPAKSSNLSNSVSQKTPRTPQEILAAHSKSLDKLENKLTPDEIEINDKWKQGENKINNPFSPVLVANNPALVASMRATLGEVNIAQIDFVENAVKLLKATDDDKFEEALKNLVKMNLHPGSPNSINVPGPNLRSIKENIINKMEITVKTSGLDWEPQEIIIEKIDRKELKGKNDSDWKESVKKVVKECLAPAAINDQTMWSTGTVNRFQDMMNAKVRE